MKFFKYLAWVVGILGVIGLVLYLAVFDVWTVPADDPWLAASIEPTLSPGDVVIVSRHGTPDRAHLVMCPDPAGRGTLIARLIGMEGETVTFSDEVVSVDGTRTPSPRACKSRTLKHPETGEDVEHRCGVEQYGGTDFDALRAEARPEPPISAKVDPAKAYLVSDNRHLHWDSRNYGQIDPTTCRHIVYRLWGASGYGDSSKRFTVIW